PTAASRCRTPKSSRCGTRFPTAHRSGFAPETPSAAAGKALAITAAAASLRSMRRISLAAAVSFLILAPATAMPPPLPAIEGKDAATLQQDMTAGRINSEVVTAAYLD